MIRRHVVAHGLAQGVGFRDSTLRRARQHGVAGWVRNTADGAVEAVLEGPDEDVELVVEFVRRGPRGSRVDRVDVEEEEPEGLSGFGVLF